jgi:hypothetical protein
MSTISESKCRITAPLYNTNAFLDRISATTGLDAKSSQQFVSMLVKKD